jgi:hypothetical protein
MQMMPSMYGQSSAMSGFGFGGYPYSSPSFSMPPAAPMMAAATPLPVAFNPLVQGMYPAASMSPTNWMTPSSFMSALSSGPMPYRPPAFDFPSNIGMVMPIPYGTPNPFLSAPSGGFSPYNSGNGSWSCCCCYCVPPATAPAPPPICYYPRPVSVPQPYPVPCPVPVPVPNIQQVPVPRPVSVVAPPIIAECNPISAAPFAAPLWPSQGAFTNAYAGQPMVMASNHDSMPSTYIGQPANGSLPVYNPVDQSHSSMNQTATLNLPYLGPNTNGLSGITPSEAKSVNQLYQTSNTTFDRFQRYIPSVSHSNYDLTKSQSRSEPTLPPILRGQLISDSGWLPKTSKKYRSISSMLTGKKRKRPLYTPENSKSIFQSIANRASSLSSRRHHRSDSSASEYDCPICQQERDKRRLRKHYGVSTVASLLSSSSKDFHGRHLPTNETVSSAPYVSTSFKSSSHKSYRRHPRRLKSSGKSLSPKASSSPILLRRSPIKEERKNGTIYESEEEEEEKREKKVEKKLSDVVDSASEKSDHRESPNSINSEGE